MALIRCEDCNAEVSDRAPACPKCGGPIGPTRTASGRVVPPDPVQATPVAAPVLPPRLGPARCASCGANGPASLDPMAASWTCEYCDTANANESFVQNYLARMDTAKFSSAFKLGKVAYETGNYPEAAQRFEQALSENAASAEPWAYRGLALAHMYRAGSESSALAMIMACVREAKAIDTKSEAVVAAERLTFQLVFETLLTAARLGIGQAIKAPYAAKKARFDAALAVCRTLFALPTLTDRQAGRVGELVLQAIRSGAPGPHDGKFVQRARQAVLAAPRRCPGCKQEFLPRTLMDAQCATCAKRASMIKLGAVSLIVGSCLICAIGGSVSASRERAARLERERAQAQARQEQAAKLIVTARSHAQAGNWEQVSDIAWEINELGPTSQAAESQALLERASGELSLGQARMAIEEGKGGLVGAMRELKALPAAVREHHPEIPELLDKAVQAALREIPEAKEQEDFDRAFALAEAIQSVKPGPEIDEAIKDLTHAKGIVLLRSSPTQALKLFQSLGEFRDSVAQAENARVLEAAEEKQRAAEEAERNRMGRHDGDPSPTEAIPGHAKHEGVVTAEIQGKEYLPSDFESRRLQDRLEFKFLFRSTLSRDVRAFTGSLVFIDLFQREIMSVNVTIEDLLPAKGQLSWSGGIDYNQFMDDHRTVRSKELRDLKVRLDLKSVIYADGEREDFGPE